MKSIFLLLIFILSIPITFSARCNTSSGEAIYGQDILITNSTTGIEFGSIMSFQVTKNAFYTSSYMGEWARIEFDGRVTWARDYGNEGFSIAVSNDESYLILGAEFGRLFKVNALTGALIQAVNSSVNDDSTFNFIFIENNTCLTINTKDWFSLLNATSMTQITYGGIWDDIYHGALINSTHFLLSLWNGSLMFLNSER